MKTLVSRIKDFLLTKLVKSVRPVGHIHQKLEGRFTFVLTKPDGTSRTVADFSNLITDGGLDRIGSGSPYLDYIHLGTGSTSPTFADTALTTFLASSSTAAPTLDNVSTTAVSSPYYVQYTMNKRFAAGIATGNLTEVGVSWSSTTGSLFSHALILDGGGNPTTITKLADEVLDVLYTFRVYAPLADVSATVGGYSTVLRAAQVTTANVYPLNGWHAQSFGVTSNGYTGLGTYSTQTLGAITSYPSGTASSSTSSLDTYVNGTYTRTGTFSCGLTEGNSAGGIGSIGFKAGFGTFQCSFTPVIPKDSTKVLTITWSISWGRV
jgi:hypothetical protein